jgi:tetratricopeptide (TPR) repeat protein
MIRIPEEAAGRRLSASQVSSYWTRRALEEIARDPAWWIGHLARKAYLWFGAEELSNNRDLRFWTRRFPIIRGLPIRYGVLVPLAFVGLWLLPWRKTAPLALFILPYALSFIAFFVTSRYRVVTVPFLAILSAGALDRLGELARRRDFAPLGARLAVVAGIAAFFSSGLAPVQQPTFALTYQEIARREMERGEWAAAAAACREALAIEPDNLDARHDLGLALREGGDPAAALTELLAVATARGDATAWNNVALTYWALGRRSEARDAFARATASDPRSPDAWLNGALMSEEEGDWSAALASLERGGSLRPNDPMVWYHKGLVLANLGRGEEARSALRRCLELEPRLSEARALLDSLGLGDGTSAPSRKESPR